MSNTFIHRGRARLQPHLFAGVGRPYNRVPPTRCGNINQLKIINLLGWHGYCIAYRRQASKVFEEANNKKVRIL